MFCTCKTMFAREQIVSTCKIFWLHMQICVYTCKHLFAHALNTSIALRGTFGIWWRPSPRPQTTLLIDCPYLVQTNLYMPKIHFIRVMCFYMCKKHCYTCKTVCCACKTMFYTCTTMCTRVQIVSTCKILITRVQTFVYTCFEYLDGSAGAFGIRGRPSPRPQTTLLIDCPYLV